MLCFCSILRRAPCRAILPAALAFCAFAVLSGESAAQSSTTYLVTADIGYKPPPAPDNDSKIGKRDLREVIAAQGRPDSERREAFEDAAAYDYDDLLPRFSFAAGTSLNLHTRPILAHMLKVALSDVSQFVNSAKHAKARARPYVEDGKIIPCETDYLPPSDYQSYPSGHSANGNTAALLLSLVIPEREPLIMARGVRYGNNRVVCGVHHPTDVEQGRKIADAYIDTALSSSQFQADFVCAVEEHQFSIAFRKGDRPPYSPKCVPLAAAYTAEAEAQDTSARNQRHSFVPQ
jgi:acid phosphatase (class A)